MNCSDFGLPAVAFWLLCIPATQAREWTSDGGTYSVQAELVKFDGLDVELGKDDRSLDALRRVEQERIESIQAFYSDDEKLDRDTNT